MKILAACILAVMAVVTTVVFLAAIQAIGTQANATFTKIGPEQIMESAVETTPLTEADAEVEVAVKLALDLVEKIATNNQRYREYVSLNPNPLDQQLAAAQRDLEFQLGVLDREIVEMRLAGNRLLAGDRSPATMNRFQVGIDNLKLLNGFVTDKLVYVMALRREPGSIR